MLINLIIYKCISLIPPILHLTHESDNPVWAQIDCTIVFIFHFLSPQHILTWHEFYFLEYMFPHNFIRAWLPSYSNKKMEPLFLPIGTSLRFQSISSHVFIRYYRLKSICAHCFDKDFDKQKRFYSQSLFLMY